MINKIFLLIFSSIIFTGCSIAPLAPTNSARSYGKGKIHSELGSLNNIYHLKLGLGVSENLDFGFDMEFGDISTSAFYLKYAFANNAIGPSWGIDFGYGASDTSSLYYFGLNTSLAFSEYFELFLNGRLASVSTEDSDIEANKYYGNLKITDYKLNYLQITSGFNLWITRDFGLSLYATTFQGDKVEMKKDTIVGGSFLFNY